MEKALSGAFVLDSVVDAFRYRTGLDLNRLRGRNREPEGDDAGEAALVSDGGRGLDGSSFAAVQQWVTTSTASNPSRPDTRPRNRAPKKRQCGTQGRAGRGPLSNAPNRKPPTRPCSCSAGPCPGRTAQRRVSCRVVQQQSGRLRIPPLPDDGAADRIVDHLFRFTRPVTGAYFWCPPIRDGGRRPEPPRLIPRGDLPGKGFPPA